MSRAVWTNVWSSLPQNTSECCQVFPAWPRLVRLGEIAALCQCSEALALHVGDQHEITKASMNSSEVLSKWFKLSPREAMDLPDGGPGPRPETGSNRLAAALLFWAAHVSTSPSAS